jgi:hypothetical protein
MVRRDMDGCDDFTGGILLHVQRVAVEALCWRLPTKPAIGIWGVTADIGLVRAIVLVLLLQPEEIHPGCDIGAVEHMEFIGKEPSPRCLV